MKIKFFILLLVFLLSAFALAEEETFVINDVLADNAGKMLFISSKNQNQNIEYEITKLSEPERMVLDIKNAVLKSESGKKSLSLNNENFKEEIRIAQFSTEPNVVRAVFTAESPEALEKIKIATYKNAIIVKFDDIKPAKDSATSIYRDRSSAKLTSPQEITIDDSESDNKAAVLSAIKVKVPNNIVINNIEQRDNRVLLSGRGVISIVEPFVLEAPTRIIFDITDAVLDSPELIKEYTLKNNDTLRIAQFDTRTVRIVIESAEPSQYTYVISPDLQSVIISPKGELSYAEFPDNAIPGQIKDIKVVKSNDLTTKVTLISERPIIHSIERLYSPDKLKLELYNILKPSEEMLASMEKTPQFHGFEIEGKSWGLPINPSTAIESKLSLDGRILEITLTDDIITAPVATSAPSQAKIIIDPGHGGYDPGAVQNGIYEKDLVLDVSRRVKKYLDEVGFYTIMTRETDKTLSLKERVELTNKFQPDLFLSIHANSANSPDIKGIETHWYTPQSRQLAMHVQDRMVNTLVIPDRGLFNSRFYVLRHTKAPAVLTEIGYMTNEAEMYQLMTEERRESTARSIADGIVNFLKSRNSGSEEPEGRKQL